MAISKALRYQILRRDNHTCRYCGGVAPDVELTVDHVLATALGGTDDPSNLVASCRDCNAGKAATSPDQALVDQVSEEAIRWAQAVRVAADKALERFGEIRAKREQFRSSWDAWTYSQGKTRYSFPLPSTWEGSIDSMLARGLPMELLLECVRITMSRPNVAVDKRFTYFCGVAWRKVNELDESAKCIYDNGDAKNGFIYCLANGHIVTLFNLIECLLARTVGALGGTQEDLLRARDCIWDKLPVIYDSYVFHVDRGEDPDEYLGYALNAYRSALSTIYKDYRKGDATEEVVA